MQAITLVDIDGNEVAKAQSIEVFGKPSSFILRNTTPKNETCIAEGRQLELHYLSQSYLVTVQNWLAKEALTPEISILDILLFVVDPAISKTEFDG